MSCCAAHFGRYHSTQRKVASRSEGVDGVSNLNLHNNLFRHIVAATMLFSVVTLSNNLVVSTVASASKTIPECSFNQLEVAVAWGPGTAAGHAGIPFIIANISRSTCTLKGYAKLLVDPDSYKGHTLKVIHGGGMIFVAVKPRLVVIKPGADASFGLNIGDAANQQDPNGAACTVQNIYVTLPLRPISFISNYETTVNFNYCYSSFEAGETSIQSGPLPKEG